MLKKICVIMLINFVFILIVGCSADKSETTKNLPDIVTKMYKNTVFQISRIGLGVNSYIIDNGRAPEDLKFDNPSVRSFHIPDYPLTDSWGNIWHYKRDDKDRTKFWIGSAGSDGKFEGFDQKGFYRDLKGQDIIYSGESIIYGPDGYK